MHCAVLHLYGRLKMSVHPGSVVYAKKPLKYLGVEVCGGCGGAGYYISKVAEYEADFK